MPLVPTVRTKYSPSEIAESLLVAFERKFGTMPSRNLAAYLYALIMLETSSGQALWNNNPGNVNTNDASQDYFLLKNKSGEFYPNHYRNYERLDLGLENFLHESVTRRPSLIRAAESGDSVAFATALRDTNYTPGLDVATHAPTYKKLADAGLAAGYFVRCPETTATIKTNTFSPRGSVSPSTGSGAALLILAAAGGIFYATTRIKPARRALDVGR